MIAGVLLAAGQSRRFGGDKLCRCLPDGRAVAVAAGQTLSRAVSVLVCVTAPENRRLRALLDQAGLPWIICPEAGRGMGHSLAAGAAALSEAEGWVIALADMPALREDTARRVSEALRAGWPLAAPLYRGRRGHPVGIAAAFGPVLRGLKGDQGAREILRAHSEKMYTWQSDDPGCAQDVDYPGDWPNLLELFN